MSWRFLGLVALALTISLGKEPLSSHAEPIAQSSMQVTPKLAQAHLDYFNSAFRKQNKGDYRGAIADYNETIRLKPDYSLAYYNRALAKSSLNDNQGAIADYNRAIEINRNWGARSLADAYTGRGLIKYNLGNKQGSLNDWSEAIRLNPDYSLVYYNRALAKSDLGDNQGAIYDYDEALRINRNWVSRTPADAYTGRGLANYNLGNKQGSIDDWNEAVRLKPDYSLAHFNLGSAKSDLGDYQGAISAYNAAIRINRNWVSRTLADAYYSRGYAKYQIEEKRGALRDFQKAAQLFRDQGNTVWYQKALEAIQSVE